MEFSFDFKITEENKKAIEKILKQKGLKYYVLEDKKTKEKLDLVEYKDYKELEEELDKYKSLYENEKDHTDTLKRIIKKVEHIVINGKLGENLDGTSYYLIHDEIGEKILDLLKEIK